MSHYTYSSLVFDGRMTRLRDNVLGYQWNVHFIGTIVLVPDAKDALPGDDIPPFVTVDWTIDNSGYTLFDTFAGLQPVMLPNTIRVNGIYAQDSERFDEYCRMIDELPSAAYDAIFQDLPTVRGSR